LEPWASPGPSSAILSRDYLEILTRRYRLIGLVCALTVAGFAVFISMRQDVYTARATLLIERRPERIIDIDDISINEPRATDFYNTQTEILRSRSLAARVIEEEGLSVPTKAYLNRLSVDPIRSSQLILISYTSQDPQLSARVVNAHSREFIRRGIDRRTKASQGAQIFLDETLADLKMRLEESEATLGEFRRKNGVIDDSGSLILEPLAMLNDELITARSASARLEAQIELLRQGDALSAQVVTTDPSVLRLKEEFSRLDAENRFRSRTLPNPALGIRLEEIESLIRLEVVRIIKGVEFSLRSARVAEKQLETRLEAQKVASLRFKDVSAEYSILAREVDTNRQLYDSVLQRKKELGMAAELRNSNVFVIDEAFPPSKPAGSSKAKLLGMGVFVGLLAGIGFVLGIELLDNTVKTSADVETVLGLPYLGTIPELKCVSNSSTTGKSPAILTATLSSTTSSSLEVAGPREAKEAYYTLRANILLSRAGESPGTILFTSALPGDGKTLTAVNIAASLAHMGSPVLLVDADLRRPKCHELLGFDREIGLTEVLAGQSDVAKVIRPVQSPLFFLGSGAQAPPDPGELLASEKMRTVLAELSRKYTYVVIDAPPILPVSDSVALSPLVDGVVLVLSRKTPLPVVQKACSRLNFAHARVLGAVLNRFDLRMTGEQYYYEG